MSNTNLDVPMGKLISEHLTVTVRAKGTTLALLRLRLAKPLLWLGAKVAGVGFDVDLESHQPRYGA